MTSQIFGQTRPWRRASRCESNGCVEVAETTGGMAVRDSTVPGGAVLHFDSTAWRSFVAGVPARANSHD